MWSSVRVKRGRATVVATAAAVTALLAAAACASDARHAGSATTTTPPPPDTKPCQGPAGVGGAVPAGLGPGDLVDVAELTTGYTATPGFPAGARVWRVLYVSMGIDEAHRTLVCGLVAAPATGPKVTAGRARMMSWAQGAIGTDARCAPSADPAQRFWAETPNGIGAIAWDAPDPAADHNGRAKNGILQWSMDNGMVVAATDYEPSRYLVGAIAGANVLDVDRAAAQLVARTWPAAAPGAYDVFLVGHSQGGAAAMWAAQLAGAHDAKAAPSKATAPIALRGVALEAPAASYIADPARQTDVYNTDGALDWAMHETVGVVPPVSAAPLELQIGPVLMSYLMRSWMALASGGPPVAAAQFPASPYIGLRTEALATPQGATTIGALKDRCLNARDAADVQAAVEPYRDAQKNAMLIPPAWGRWPDLYRPGDFFPGGLGALCLVSPDAAQQAWCSWIRYNLPGPLGDNPFEKVPTTDGVPVPILLVHGTDDRVMHCVAPLGTDNEVPVAGNCTSRALYDSLVPAYCPPGRNVGALRFTVYRPELFKSAATHFSIPGQVASASLERDPSGLTFAGSPLQKFMSSALDRSVPAGCGALVMNPLGSGRP